MDQPVLIAFAICTLAALSTVLGALSLFKVKEPNPRMLAFGLAFAGGAMVYISLVEIFVKSHLSFSAAMADRDAYSHATIAFFAGVVLVAMLDRFVPNPHAPLHEGHHGHDDKKHAARIGLMAHNIPEGMATFFASLDNPAVGAPLAAAIAIHNIPEGISIAIPVYYATGSKAKAILFCCISALAEPLGALLGYVVLGPYLSPSVYGWVFGAIAGIMVFLAIDELLPAAKRYAKGHETVYGIIGGMGAIAISLLLLR
jgi:ZIP family zinc transporter